MLSEMKLAMLQRKTTYEIAWVGVSTDNCDRVAQRVIAQCQRQGLEAAISRSDRWCEVDASHCDRVVLVADNRANYPWDAVELLSCSTNIVPWGVITESWHIGSRRSGPGPITHWQQPWFRWWDSWFAWFFPEMARPGSRVSTSFSPIVTYGDYCLPTETIESQKIDAELAILCGCPRTADLLLRQANHAGWSARVYESIESLKHSDKAPECILWDDSLLPCLPQFEAQLLLNQQLKQLKQHYPDTETIASVDLQHLDLWPELHQLGCTELFVKPSHALGLSNYLFYRSH